MEVRPKRSVEHLSIPQMVFSGRRSTDRGYSVEESQVVLTLGNDDSWWRNAEPVKTEWVVGISDLAD